MAPDLRRYWSGAWRRRRESNPGTGLCRPLLLRRTPCSAATKSTNHLCRYTFRTQRRELTGELQRRRPTAGRHAGIGERRTAPRRIRLARVGERWFGRVGPWALTALVLTPMGRPPTCRASSSCAATSRLRERRAAGRAPGPPCPGARRDGGLGRGCRPPQGSDRRAAISSGPAQGAGAVATTGQVVRQSAGVESADRCLGVRSTSQSAKPTGGGADRRQPQVVRLGLTTATGRVPSEATPTPSCPDQLLPQQTTRPPTRRAHVWPGAL
jgi:hypothetical protein